MAFIGITPEGSHELVTTGLTELCTHYPEVRAELVAMETNFSSIIARDRIIMVKLDTLRCIIFHDRALIITDGHTHDQLQEVVSYLCERISEDESLKFEHRIVKYLLERKARQLEQEIKDFKQSSQIASRMIDRDSYITMSYDNRTIQEQFHLTNLSTRVSSIDNQLKWIIDLDADDLNDFCLEGGDDATPGSTTINDQFHDTMETIQRKYGGFVDDLDDQREHFKTMMSVVKVNLTYQRLRIDKQQLFVSILTLIVGIAAWIAALFGMNLHTGWEASDIAFPIVSIISIIVGLVVWLVIRRVTR